VEVFYEQANYVSRYIGNAGPVPEKTDRFNTAVTLIVDLLLN
jgi:hypothetical protein